MSIFQALLLGFFGWLMNSPVMFGHWGYQIFRRPLIAGLICGLIMGDVAKGIMVGAVLQAMYIGTMNVGGIASMPPIDTGQWFAIPLALLQGGNAEVAIALAIPFSFLSQMLGILLMNINQIVLHKADDLITKGKLKQAYWTHFAVPNVLGLIINMSIISTLCLIGSSAIDVIVSNIPAGVMGILGIFTKIIPLLGFAILLNSLLKNNIQLIFFVLGFALVKAVGLNVITVTIIAAAIAYVIFMIQGKVGEENETNTEFK